MTEQRSQAVEKFNGLSSTFVGYDCVEWVDSPILALFSPQGRGSSLSEGATGEIVLETTPFYAEAGGQLGDQGRVITATGCFSVLDTQRVGGAWVHIGQVIEGELTVGQRARASVDEKRRRQLSIHHSCLHLFYSELQRVLGEALGPPRSSLVTPAFCRVEFEATGPLSWTLLKQVELQMNQYAQQPHRVSSETYETTPADAPVQECEHKVIRRVKIGALSNEFCGGTHVLCTSEIGCFRILSESGGRGAHVRRVEACAGEVAIVCAQEDRQLLSALSALFQVPAEALQEKAVRVVEQAKTWEYKYRGLCRRQMEREVGRLSERLQRHADWPLAVERLELDHLDQLRPAALALLKQVPQPRIALLTLHEGGLTAIAAVKDPTCVLNAQEMIQSFVKVFGGSGGGRPNLAQGRSDQVLVSLDAAVAQWSASLALQACVV